MADTNNALPTIVIQNGQGVIVPTNRTGLGLWQFVIAITCFYFAVKYLPEGDYVFGIIVLLAIMSTPDAIKTFTKLLDFIETGQFT